MALRRIVPLLGVLVALLVAMPSPACAPVSKYGTWLLNADQTVIIIWDARNKVQHFVRKASFRTETDDFGFLVPTPTRPDLQESTNAPFSVLHRITAPKEPPRGKSVKSAGGFGGAMGGEVNVLEEKRVAGYQAAVLEATTAEALVTWLKDNGYAYSPQVATWAGPYVAAGWKFTALKIAAEPGKAADKARTVSANALRITFQTDQPIFPYREPDPKEAPPDLKAKDRLLRIYFVAEARYMGHMNEETPWTGKVMWSGKIHPDDRLKLLKGLRLSVKTEPQEWWLTEFEDHWPYGVAPADLSFSRDVDQSAVVRTLGSGKGKF